jgi:hypothetical protein
MSSVYEGDTLICAFLQRREDICVNFLSLNQDNNRAVWRMGEPWGAWLHKTWKYYVDQLERSRVKYLFHQYSVVLNLARYCLGWYPTMKMYCVCMMLQKVINATRITSQVLTKWINLPTFAKLCWMCFWNCQITFRLFLVWWICIFVYFSISGKFVSLFKNFKRIIIFYYWNKNFYCFNSTRLIIFTV